MEKEIKYLEEAIEDRKSQIVYNCNQVNKGNQVIFYNNWNRDIELEIRAFRNELANIKSQLTLKSA